MKEREGSIIITARFLAYVTEELVWRLGVAIDQYEQPKYVIDM